MLVRVVYHYIKNYKTIWAARCSSIIDGFKTDCLLNLFCKFYHEVFLGAWCYLLQLFQLLKTDIVLVMV